MTTVLVSDLPAGQTLEMPCNNLLSTTMHTVAPSSIGGATAVTKVLFVDALIGALTPTKDGSIGAPFATVQQAVDWTVAHPALGGDPIVMIAPGTYVDPIAIPIACAGIILQGWANVDAVNAPTDVPNLAGNIIITGGVGDPTPVHFANLFLGGTTIASNNTATIDLLVDFRNCFIAVTTIEAFNIDITLNQTDCAAAIAATGAGDVGLTSDGYSWANIVRNAITITPSSYFRRFSDTGADQLNVTFSGTGIAIGATAVCPVVYGGARVGEFAIAAVGGITPATDFYLTFHHCEADLVVFMLTNVSRVSTNFAEAGSVAIFHAGMASPPVP
jgi:hypothetical protein